jgi:prepilin-type N-terminal cleavage/methylation domain-containing protein
MRGSDRSLGSERGFSLPELLVAIVVALIIAGAGMTLVSMAVRTQPKVSERAAQIQQGRTMLESVGRELRQGKAVTSPTPSGLSVLTYVDSVSCGGAAGSPAILCRVDYACGTTSCTRTERNPDGSGAAPAEFVVRGITGPNVFSYQGASGDPSYVWARLVFPREDGEEGVTFEGGAALRNHPPTTVAG